MAEIDSNSYDSLLVGLLTLLFVALKLTGYIEWSWWWVLSPMWISASLAIVVCGIAAIIVVKIKKSRGEQWK